ncbi:sensor histidine kinase [Kitasatospora sp. NPDC053057]|uniref:sensor histidine kinase n=1 Tax=Kitasatospora sp. NPDC053057 TaxID=3364062 RepID=UPI0037C63E1C
MDLQPLSALARRWSAGLTALRTTTAPPPRRTAWSRAADAALALALTAGTVDSALGRSPVSVALTAPTMPVAPDGIPAGPPPAYGMVVHHYGAVHPWQVALAVLAALPLLVRRRYPLSVCGTVVAASLLFHLSPGFDPLFTFLACVVAVYSAAIHSSRRVLALTGAAAATAVLVVTHESSVPALESGTATFLFLVPVALVVNTVRTWSLRERALLREKEQAALLATEQERSRIARELHDVITHHVSVMTVQAGAARKIMRIDQAEAEQTLRAVESSGRAAMTELRHAMDLLTMGEAEDFSDDDAELRPAPGLSRLPALAERVRGAGVPVELTVLGEPVQLPPGMDLAAYRVVQEAVTNAMKHAQGASVRITVEHAPRQLTLVVADSGGRPAPAAHSGNGRGLLGLRERLGVYGGTLEAAVEAGGGFRVRAVIPREAPC